MYLAGQVCYYLLSHLYFSLYFYGGGGGGEYINASVEPAYVVVCTTCSYNYFTWWRVKPHYILMIIVCGFVETLRQHCRQNEGGMEPGVTSSQPTSAQPQAVSMSSDDFEFIFAHISITNCLRNWQSVKTRPIKIISISFLWWQGEMIVCYFTGSTKFSLAECNFVLEEDGTEVDGDFFPAVEPHATLMILAGDEAWLPKGQYGYYLKQTTDITTYDLNTTYHLSVCIEVVYTVVSYGPILMSLWKLQLINTLWFICDRWQLIQNLLYVVSVSAGCSKITFFATLCRGLLNPV